MIKKTVCAVLASVITALSVAGCGGQIDEFVTVSNVNQSSVSVAEGFFQAVFTGDEELFAACYPDSFKTFTDDEGNTVDMHEVFEEYCSLSDPDYTYLGASLSAYNDYDADHGYDFPPLAEDIAALHHTSVELIEAAQIVKLRLNFQNADNERLTTEIYILVYKSEAAWYVFELQNSDAEFAV